MLERPEKPRTFNGDLANLPAALAPLCHLDRWVVWSWEWRGTKNGGGKWTKPPRQARDPKRFAKSNDKSTWGRYADAVAAVAAGKADGIGYMMKGSDIAAADLDHCLDPETAALDPWAEELHTAANGAYREVTVSGCGLRIIGTAKGAEVHTRVTFDRETGAGLELYRDAARFITVSGNQFGSCAALAPLDDFIDTLEKRYRNGANGKTRGFDFNAARPQQSAEIDYDDLIRNGAPEGQRSELFQKCVWHLATAGKSIDEIVAILAQHINGIGAKYTSRLRAEVERSYEKWQAGRQPRPGPDTEEPEDPLRWDKVGKHGVPVPTWVNAQRAIMALNVTCRRDAFHDRFLVEGKVVKNGRANLDHTALELRGKIHKAFGFDPGIKNTTDALIHLCLKGEFDPVLDYLDGLHWDGGPRLDRWLITYTGADDTKLNREFGSIALIAAVRRARHPGCKFDPIIVLEGPMGTQKSRAIEILAGVENFSDQTILGLRDREQQELLAGVWLYEIAELTHIHKTNVEHIKAFASRTHDRSRPAYGHFRVDQPRRCVLFATTNNDQYLKEVDRRFWPVKTTEIDIEALRRDRDQLWAEAAQRERDGASIVLRRELWGEARIEQQAREESDPWDDKLVNASGTVEQDEERVSSADLLEVVLGIHISKQRDVDFKRMGRCMRRLGWDGPKKTKIGGIQVKGYTRPAKGTGGTGACR